MNSLDQDIKNIEAAIDMAVKANDAEQANRLRRRMFELKGLRGDDLDTIPDEDAEKVPGMFKSLINLVVSFALLGLVIGALIFSVAFTAHAVAEVWDLGWDLAGNLLN